MMIYIMNELYKKYCKIKLLQVDYMRESTCIPYEVTTLKQNIKYYSVKLQDPDSVTFL
jgi:hypothetical protein